MILDTIVSDKKIRLKEHKERIPLDEMRRLAENAAAREDMFYKAMSRPGISIIGEYKKASPSLGQIRQTMELPERIELYNASVDAISCLTEEDHFNGDVDDLRAIRNLSALPILRKDFMIDEYQFYEARAIGADAVLLITAILDDYEMHDFYQLARELKLGVLTETHDEYEIERALKTDSRIIGINNRNLKDFTVSVENTGRLIGYIPDDRLCIAESGIMGDKEVEYLVSVGADGFLIGRAFMESEDPAALAAGWKAMADAGTARRHGHV